MTQAKSRTRARPALSHRGLHIVGRAFSILGPVSYLFLVVILFQFVSVQLALGFSETSISPSFPINTTAQGFVVDTVQKTATGIPVRLKIPKLGVNAVIRSVGLTPDGSMGVPKKPSETAWFMLGPRPGDQGSAVIAGHVNWLYGATAVFARLNTLKPGDLMTVTDDQGKQATFVVRNSRTFDIKDGAADVFRATDGKSHLNLVTCSGVWNKKSKMYSKRLVVFADKVE